MKNSNHNTETLQKKTYAPPSCRAIDYVAEQLIASSDPDSVNDSLGDEGQFSNKKERNQKTIWNSTDETQSTWLK